MDDTNLKPCPFCGGEAGVYKRFDIPEIWAVACTNCGVETFVDYSKYRQAVSGWNNRAWIELWKRRKPDDPGHHIVLNGT